MKRLSAALVAVLALGALALAPAASAASSAEVHGSIEAATAWLRTQQGPNQFEPEEPYDGGIPGFGGDWAATAFAATGADTAGVVNPTYGPGSLQDHLLAEYTSELWTGLPGTTFLGATDYQRAALVAYAAGLDPARLSADSNLPAQIAGTWDGATGSFGPASANGTAFGILALRHTPVPAWALAPAVAFLRRTQHDDGGWEFAAALTPEQKEAPGAPDMTGAAIAALCEAGVPAYDPQVAAGIAFLKKSLTPDGGFEYPFGGPNTDSNAWAVSGLNACGIDPQSAEWTSTAGKTPVDYMLANQIATAGPEAGSFGYNEPSGANLYVTQDSIRALAGGVFTATPPSLRTPPAVAAGTPVRHLVAIRLGAENVRMCEVTAPVGASLTALLEAGATNSVPAGCITGLEVDGGRLGSLDGVAREGSDEAWLARLDRGPAAVAGSQSVGFGDAVALWIGAAPASSGSPGGGSTATGPAGPAGAAGKEGKPGKRGKRGPVRTCKAVKAKGKRKVRCTGKHLRPAKKSGDKRKRDKPKGRHLNAAASRP